MTSALGQLPFDFEKPVWLWLCLLVPVLVAVSARSLSGLDPVRRVLAILVRSVLVILLACCLAGAQSIRRSEDLTVLFLMDRSHSVQALQDSQEEFIRTVAETKPPDDRLGLIDFARNAYLEQLPSTGGYIIPPGRLPMMPNTDRTDIASAVRLAMAMFPHDTSKRIVLMSDGNDNMGDILAEAKRAKAAGIPIDVVPLWYEHRNEVFFDRMIAPTQAEPGEQVPIRMVLNSHRAVDGSIAIYHNGKPVSLPSEQTRVSLRPGSNTFFMRLPVEAVGAHTYEAIFRPDDESMDGVALNNSARAFTFVSGASSVLLVTTDPLHDQPLFDALLSEKVKVEMKSTAELGEFGLLQMMNYSAIILCNVPAAVFTEKQQQELAVYVKDMGSGLIMTGGDEGFGAGGWIGTPIEEVMPVTFEVKHKRVIPRGALVLIMHSCEMPRGNFWGKEMAKKSVDTIASQDYLGVLAYTWSPGGTNWEVPLDLATNKAAVKAKIDRMGIGDMPDFGPSMQMAYKELTTGRGRDAAQKHVIILSDGDAMAPARRLLADYKKSEITVSTIAIGWGAHVKEPVMQDIARKTGGRYYRARNPRQLPQIFVKESKVVRRPLIVDEPFQPQLRHVESDLLAGIATSTEALPPLGGMILTSVKPSPNVLLPIIRPSDDGDDPVLAHWQYELGKTVAFTSGQWPIWGTEWTRWDRFAKLWAQIVRWTMRQESPANFETSTKVEGNRGRIVVDALDKDASFLNFLQLNAKVVGPDDEALPLKFLQTGPGHYEAEFDAEQAGQYLAGIQITEKGKSRGTIRTGLSIPFSPEYRDLSPNEGLLRQVADLSNGRWLDLDPRDASVFSHDLAPTQARRPAWEWMVAWLLLPAFLIDVAVRRLANWLAFSIAVELVVLVVLLFGLEWRYASLWGIVGSLVLAELIGWTIRFRYIGPAFDLLTHGVTALSQTGERSQASLEQLKTKHERIRENINAESSESYQRIAQEAEPVLPHTAKKRFDVAEAGAKKEAGDLADALGGAKAESVPKPTSPQQEGPPGQRESTTTSRLLRARRRTQQDKEQDP